MFANAAFTAYPRFASIARAAYELLHQRSCREARAGLPEGAGCSYINPVKLVRGCCPKPRRTSPPFGH